MGVGTLPLFPKSQPGILVGRGSEFIYHPTVGNIVHPHAPLVDGVQSPTEYKRRAPVLPQEGRLRA